jgi:hypothetical protein
MKRISILLAMGAVLMTGCGGSGGGGTSNVPYSSVLRQFAAGDRWVYNVTGVRETGATIENITGTETLTVDSRVGTAVVFKRVQSLSFNGGAAVVREDTISMTQSTTTGAMALVSDTRTSLGTTRTVVTNSFTFPGNWTFPPTISTTGATTFDNGDTDAQSLTADAASNTTALGRSFGTVEVSQTRNTSNPGVGSISVDEGSDGSFSPTLAQPVKFTRVTTVNSATPVVTTLNGTLTSTTVPLP